MTEFDEVAGTFPKMFGKPVMLYAWDSAAGMWRPVQANAAGQMMAATGAAAPASSFRNIAGAGTTLIKSGAGKLLTVVLNRMIALSQTTLYDSLSGSGSKIATIVQPISLLASQVTLQYGCGFVNGLTVVTTAADDITVIYE